MCPKFLLPLPHLNAPQKRIPLYASTQRIYSTCATAFTLSFFLIYIYSLLRYYFQLVHYSLLIFSSFCFLFFVFFNLLFVCVMPGIKAQVLQMQGKQVFNLRITPLAH